MKKNLLLLLLALTLNLLSNLSSYAFQNVQLKVEFGQEGSGPGQLMAPQAIAIDSDGTLYIADRANKRIHVMTHDGKTVRTFGDKKTEIGYFEEPAGICLYENLVYVSDTARDRIIVFTKDGRFVEEFGTSGNGPKEFDDPAGLTLHLGILYVADRGNHRVQIFSKDGIYLGSIGSKGDREGQLKEPADVAVDYNGNIYVADYGNSRVVVFYPDGRFKRNYYDLKRPVSIDIDQTGFVVADSEDYKIKKFDFSGRLLFSAGTKGTGSGQFLRLSAIALSPDGEVYALDSRKNTVQVFSPERIPSPMVEASPPRDSVNLIGKVKIKVSDVCWARGILYAVSSQDNAVYVIEGNSIKRVIMGKGDFELKEIYVLDSGNQRIEVFDHNGRFIRKFGSKGAGKGEFIEPSAIAINELTILSVADRGRTLQTFKVLHTPQKVLNVKAFPGRKEITLLWPKSIESFVLDYRIYRSENKVHYKFIASTPELSYTDRDVKPGTTYYYRISARAKDGYEGQKSEPLTAVAMKPLIRPPSGIIAKPGIKEIELSWNREGVSLFIISRKLKDSYEEIAKTDRNVFIDKGLLPETEYSYRIEAINPDGEKSEPVEIKAKTMSDKSPLDITVLQMRDIITKAYRLYEKEGLGRIRLRNNISSSVRDVRVQFVIKEFMDYPSETGLKEIGLVRWRILI